MVALASQHRHSYLRSVEVCSRWSFVSARCINSYMKYCMCVLHCARACSNFEIEVYTCAAPLYIKLLQLYYRISFITMSAGSSMDRADGPSPGTYDVPAWVERFEKICLRGLLDNRSAKNFKADGVANVEVRGRARIRCELDC